MHGWLADVSVITLPDPFEDGFWGSSYWLDVQNATLFRSGRPVLLVPPQAGRPNFETVVIAWKQSLEAARAIAAAQPFMAMAREVHLFTINDGTKAVTSLREAEEYLSLHYDEVRSEVVSGEPHQVGKLLLNAGQPSRSLIGHGRLQPLALAGTSLRGRYGLRAPGGKHAGADDALNCFLGRWPLNRRRVHAEPNDQ